MNKYSNNIDKEFYGILEILKKAKIDDIIEMIKEVNPKAYKSLLSRYNFYKYWVRLILNKIIMN